MYDYSNDDMAVKLHICQRSYCRKLKDVGRMTVSDLLTIEKALHTELINTERRFV